MFSKAKRFDDKPVGCGADVVYAPKDSIKSVGTTPKQNRALDTKKSASDVESASSEKSSSVFRTPKVIKRIPVTPSKKKNQSSDANSKELMEELLSAKNVEIKNKDETISEYELQIKEMSNKIKSLEDDLQSAKASFAKLESDILRDNEMEVDTLKLKHIDEMTAIEDQFRKILDDEITKHDKNLKNVLEKHNKKLRNLEEEFGAQMAHLEENATERVRICEIQFEERYNDLQTYSESQIDKERALRYEEVKLCKEIAEKERKMFEIKLNNIKCAFNERENKINALNAEIVKFQESDLIKENIICELKSIKKEFLDQKSDYEAKISLLKRDLGKLNKEKNMFSMALDTTRKTVDVLGERLHNSDSHVENFKSKLDKALSLNMMYEEEIVDLQIEFNCFQDEYKQLLMTIVNSKASLDKSHEEIVSKNAALLDSLENMNNDVLKTIDNIKSELISEVEKFKNNAQNTIDDISKQLEDKHNLYTEMKVKCDEAYAKIGECRELILSVEAQLEMKDHEIEEVATENVRLAGTLAASDQEKSELEILLNEFVKLVEDKDLKIFDLMKRIEKLEDDVVEADDKVANTLQLLEATEFVIKEKDNEVHKYKEKLEKQEKEKIVIHQKHNAQVEKLKKDLAENNQKKQFLQMHSPHGKENRQSLSSPNKLASPKPEKALTPLRELNRL